MIRPVEIPIFPLATVLYPAGLLPLRIFEPRYVEMTKACIRDNSVFGVSLIRAGYEVGQPAIPCDIGCTARIAEWDVPNPGMFTLLARGETVFRIIGRRIREDGLIVGQVELRQPADPVTVPPRHRRLAALLARLIDEVGDEHFPRPQRIDDAAWVGNRLCELLPVGPERKQALLETENPLTLLGEVEQLIEQLRGSA